MLRSSDTIGCEDLNTRGSSPRVRLHLLDLSSSELLSLIALPTKLTVSFPMSKSLPVVSPIHPK